MALTDELQEIINTQKKEIEALKDRIAELETKKHNERGAGRKSNLRQEQVDKINELHLQGLSYGTIAKEIGISKAYVYKLINKQKIMTEVEYNRYREGVNILRKGLRDMGHNHAGTRDLPPYEKYIKLIQK